MRGLEIYLLCSSSILLGVVGKVVFSNVIRSTWDIDTVTLNLLMYNFAVVGTVSIFYQKGVTSWVADGDAGDGCCCFIVVVASSSRSIWRGHLYSWHSCEAPSLE